MALSKITGDEAYKKLIRDAELTPSTYKDVVEDWERNNKEWYHPLIAIEDLSTVLAIPSLKIYVWCWCKVVANDGFEAHLHWHALDHFSERKLASWRGQACRLDIKFKSSKNTFKLQEWKACWTARWRWSLYTSTHALRSSAHRRDTPSRKTLEWANGRVG